MDNVPGVPRDIQQFRALLGSILDYYSRTRQVGHTRSLFSGLGFVAGSSLRPTVVVNSDLLAKVLSPGNGVMLADFSKWAPGKHKPLIWDNSAIIALCEMMAAVLDKAEEHRLTAIQEVLRRIEGDLDVEEVPQLEAPHPT